MKVHTVSNPKTKKKLLHWMEQQPSPFNKEDLEQLGKILSDVTDDFILDRRRMYSIIACDKYLYLVESPLQPDEIFEYITNNPDKLSKFVMRMITPVLRMYLMGMFDVHEGQYT